MKTYITHALYFWISLIHLVNCLNHDIKFIAKYGKDRSATGVSTKPVWARSLVSCSVACIRHPGCRSYNYLHKTGPGEASCRLIEGSLARSATTTTAGITYYEGIYTWYIYVYMYIFCALYVHIIPKHAKTSFTTYFPGCILGMTFHPTLAKCYRLVNRGMTFNQARRHCVSLGHGIKLVEIYSSREQNFVAQLADDAGRSD